MKLKVGLLSVAMGISGLSGIANADNSDYIKVVTEQLAQADKFIVEAAIKDGRRAKRMRRVLSDTSDDQNHSFYFTDLALGNYIAVAYCDSDCSDIDLILKQADGETVESDVKDDDKPVLEFYVDPLQAHYQLDVDIIDCDATTCFYGLAIYSVSGSFEK